MNSIRYRDEDLQLRDGTLLKSRIWSPQGNGPWPVLLMRQPYGREIASTVTYAHPSWWASNGYLVVSRGLLALVGGPSVLFYGVAIIEDYVSRHVVGIVCSVLFIQLELLYYTIEIHTRRYFNPNNEFFILSLILIVLLAL